MKVFVDGGGNRKGNCYYGIAFYRGDQIVKKLGKSLPDASTNNEAEYDALIQALHILNFNAYDLTERAENVTIYMDSELVVKQVLGEYEVKAENLLQRVKYAKEGIQRLREYLKPNLAVWLKNIPREENELADSIGREALELRTNDTR